MTIHKLAGKPASQNALANVPRLISCYYSQRPDVVDPLQKVSFGTSGHRGSSFRNSFNEDHILAVSQAICDYRKSQSIDGPLFIGMDTHALSEPAFISAIEVFAANGVLIMYQKGRGYTPTPVISHAILNFNRGKTQGFADGVVITPSHNPPEDGGFKYNTFQGGPADRKTTRIIEENANRIIADGLKSVKRVSFEKAIKADSTRAYDYISSYVADLENVVDMSVIAKANLKIGADPLGGAAVEYVDVIAKRYGLNIEVVNPVVDPVFSFMTLDHDGKIRMDCSSPYAMAGLIRVKDRFDVIFANDPDADRHGIVTKSAGLLNPNHFLVVSADYLFKNRPQWKKEAAVGKTLVSTSLIDRVAASLGRRVYEVPVGFKWFVDGLLDGVLGFVGEESAGASFLRRDGTVWTTDKDGIVMGLLACEITARSGKDPGELYRDIEKRLGSVFYQRIDAPALPEQKAALKKLSPDDVTASELAGDPILFKFIKAPGNDAEIGGLKVVTEGGWFAARPSGTEDICKIYAESFRSEKHLQMIIQQAVSMVEDVYQNVNRQHHKQGV